MKSIAPCPPGLRWCATFALLAVLAGCATAQPASAPAGAPESSAAGTAPAGPGVVTPPPVAQDAPAQPAPRAQRIPRRNHEPEPAEALPEIELTSQILFQVLASEIAAQRGQTSSAAATYLSLARQTRDPRFARRATELALAERSLERAMQAAQLWTELAPGSALAAQTLESLWLSTGRLAEAEPLLVARLERARKEGTVAEFYQQLQRTLSRAGDKTAALALIDRISAGDASSADARLAVAAVAHAAGQNERAAAEAGKAMALRPDDEDPVVTRARYMLDTPEGTAGAIALIEGFLARQPKAVEARFLYARLLASQGRAQDARTQMELALKQEPDSPPILFSLAQIAYQTQQLDVAEDYLKRYVALPRTVPRDNGPAYVFLAQIAEDRGRPADAIAWLQNVTGGEQYLQAVVRRAVLLGKLSRVDEARELLNSTSVATSRERVQLVAAEAQVLREAKRPQEAFDVLDKALERMPDDPDLLYDHAMAAERIDRLQVMEASLRKLIALRPENAHAYNALGYSLADRNLRLEEAQALIEKALSLAPEDAHIMDSMGWVLYRRGKLEQAADYLQRAYKLRPEAEIAAHLGEVLWKMGRVAEARSLWRDARGREPDNETLKETLARLNVVL